MLGARGFSQPCNSPSPLTKTSHKTTSFSLLFPLKTHLSFPFNSASNVSYSKGQSGSCAFAVKRQGKEERSVVDMDTFDDDDDDDDYDDDIGFSDGDDEDDDEGMFIPFGDMKRWLENKPRGFGEGKVYDTSIEDGLLEEIEQSRQAQVVNINKLKNSPVKPASKKESHQKQKATEVSPSGVCVRLLNLPKKRNIHRDLQSAFKGVPGIINIIPAVSGNKKTRDPVCKGFAFVDFKSEEDANRFIQVYSGQSLTFGKIQKQIKCERANQCPPNSAHEQSIVDAYTTPQIVASSSAGDSYANFDVVVSPSDSGVETVSDESDCLDDDFIGEEWESIGENMESFDVSELNGDVIKPRKESAKDSLLKKIQENEKKIQAREKRPVVRRKREKVLKSNTLGSANRLKIKDKAVLTDVFSKYALNGASASGEES